jgi:hypothetical protein
LPKGKSWFFHRILWRGKRRGKMRLREALFNIKMTARAVEMPAWLLNGSIRMFPLRAGILAQAGVVFAKLLFP